MQSDALERGIGRWTLVALVVNSVVGAAILGLPGKTFALVGGYSVIAWVPCAFVVGLIAACFAEVGSRFARTGGPYLYAYEAFGPGIGFLVGWLSWVSRMFSLATITNLMITYAGGFVPTLLLGWPRVAAITALSLLLTSLVLGGVRLSTTVGNGLSVCKLLLLGGFVVGGLVMAGSWSRVVPVTMSQTSAHEWRSATMLMTFAFVGIESAMINTGEMRNPVRDIPFALGVGLLIIVLLYIGVQVVCINVVADLAQSQRPIADAAYFLWGNGGKWIMGVGAFVIMYGTLFAVLLTASRLPFALAESGQMPGFLAAVHPRLKTPWVAIILTATLAWVLAICSSFIGALTVTTLTRLVGYAMTCAALWVLRRKQPEGSHFRLPYGAVVALVAVLCTLWLMLGSSSQELLLLAALTLAGATFSLVFTVARRRGRCTSIAGNADPDGVRRPLRFLCGVCLARGVADRTGRARARDVADR